MEGSISHSRRAKLPDSIIWNEKKGYTYDLQDRYIIHEAYRKAETI